VFVTGIACPLEHPLVHFRGQIVIWIKEQIIKETTSAD